MKALVRSFCMWLVVILLGLNLILWGTIIAHCQTTKEPLHTSLHKETIEQQDEIRVMFITVTEKNGNSVYFYRTGKNAIEISSLFWDEQSVLKDPSAKQPYKFKGCYIALICLKHTYLYWLQRVACTDDTRSFYFT